MSQAVTVRPLPELLSWPEQGVSRVPLHVHSDPEIYAWEQDLIFRGPSWHFLGLEIEVPKPGDYITTFVGDTSVIMIRTEHTLEGMTFYRQIDLPLVRDRSQAFTRSWTAMHSIGKDSALYGMTEAQMHAEEIEFVVSVVGTDDTSLQPVHAQRHYSDTEVIWGARHADVLSELPDGTIILDLTKFHDTVPTPATPEFPYGLKT